MKAVASDEQIEQVASLMYAAALAFTNTIGRKGWAWELCDDETKQFWRNMAHHAWNIFSGSNPA
jgi:hypothetical protein